ncbi:MAG: dTDP-4-dehydrorhamnose reductase, partial [Aquificaceae bacterium]
LKVEFLALDRQSLDITNFQHVMGVFKDYKPHVVINCAAYNLVDKAEEEFEKALQVNCLGVVNLALACAEEKALLVHYSTDYVFDGQKEGLYTEEDKPNPLSKYALSKYLGEVQLRNIWDRSLIFRTSWVYGRGTQNFLYKLTEWAKTREYLRIACDEFSVPTYTKTIVKITLLSIKEGLRGLYHLVSSGYASRYEWAKEYLRLKGIEKFIYPAYQSEFNLPAKRARWTAMSNKLLSNTLNIEIEHWQEVLREAVESGELS